RGDCRPSRSFGNTLACVMVTHFQRTFQQAPSMSGLDCPEPYFLFLCSADRQPLLTAMVVDSPCPVIFVETIEQVLTHGVQRPPLALILEISTAIRFGAERMSKFLNLGVSWPVMRCAVQPD